MPFTKAFFIRTSAGRTVVYIDSDGNLVMRVDGTRSWRNNNPGNLIYSDFVLPDDFGTTNLNLKLALPCY